MNTEKIDAFLQQEGVQKEQLVLEWIKQGQIDKRLLLQKLESFEIVKNVSQVKPGMFYHANGNISEEYVGDDCIAMIISVSRKNKMAIALVFKNETLPFSSDNLSVNTSGLNGSEATDLICHQAAETGKCAEAAWYCRNFSCNGVKRGTAFLPSEREIMDMIAYMFNIRTASMSCGISLHYVMTASCNGKKVKVCQIGGSDISEEITDFPLQVHPAIKIDLKDFH